MKHPLATAGSARRSTTASAPSPTERKNKSAACPSVTKVETSVDNDMVQDFVLLANKEIFKRTGVSTYIIETTSVKKYRGEENDVYECMFMVVKNSGFAFGFSVVASFEVKGSKIRLVSLRSQPLGVQAPSNVAAYTEGSEGKEFIDYKLVKEKSVPCKSELDSVKNKLQ